MVSAGLLATAADIVAETRRSTALDEPPVYSSLLVAQLGEALRLELRDAQREDVTRLETAIERCEDATRATALPALLMEHLQSVLLALDPSLARRHRSVSALPARSRFTAMG